MSGDWCSAVSKRTELQRAGSDVVGVAVHTGCVLRVFLHHPTCVVSTAGSDDQDIVWQLVRRCTWAVTYQLHGHRMFWEVHGDSHRNMDTPLYAALNCSCTRFLTHTVLLPQVSKYLCTCVALWYHSGVGRPSCSALNYQHLQLELTLHMLCRNEAVLSRCLIIRRCPSTWLT
jgi:hypothetical protein